MEKFCLSIRMFHLPNNETDFVQIASLISELCLYIFGNISFWSVFVQHAINEYLTELHETPTTDWASWLKWCSRCPVRVLAETSTILRFFMVIFSPSGPIPRWYLALGHGSFLPHPFQLIICYHPII
jgi:hypothetical protein